MIAPKQFSSVIGLINTSVVNGIGWYYVLVVTFFLIFAIVGAFSRLGNIRLGRDDERPRYGLLSWFSMLFAAGDHRRDPARGGRDPWR
ncbi:MAG: BCCT family transporter [Arachnia sp.]